MRPTRYALLCLFLFGALPARAQTTTVQGMLLGADGEPMQRAHVVVEDGPVDTTLFAEADEPGSFRLSLPEPGRYGMYLMGLYHETLEMPIVVTDTWPVELEVQLNTSLYQDEMDTVHVVGPALAESGVLMERHADGTFTARIETEADTLAYQILGATATPWGQTYRTAGTEADRLVFRRKGPFWDPHSDYVSVLDVSEYPVTVTFDPAALPRTRTGLVVRSSPSYVAEIYRDVEERERRIGMTFRSMEGAFGAASEAEHPETQQAENMRRRFSEDRAVQPGRPIPSFSFLALEDSAITYTDEGLRGRTYLVDFWGTWCGPCIEELPYLHEAYEQFQDQGFEILSVAMMDERAAIEAFREERYPMPWLHTMGAQEDDRAVRDHFEITGFPRPILVDETGTILAADDAVRGSKLLKVLSERYGVDDEK